MCSKYVDEVVTVTDDEISAAILALMERHKLVTEGTGAVAVAAAMFNKVDLKGKKAVCLLSGGNIDVTILSRVIAREGGNVTAVFHEHTCEGSDVNGCYLRLTLETRNFEHIASIRNALSAAGFKLLERAA